MLRDIYDEHAGLQDRFRSCGQVTPELAARLGLTGFAGRASGLRGRPALRLPDAALRHAGGAPVTRTARRCRGAGRGALRRDCTSRCA